MIDLPPSRSMAAQIMSPSSRILLLQGRPLEYGSPTVITGLLKSSSPHPAARRFARLGSQSVRIGAHASQATAAGLRAYPHAALEYEADSASSLDVSPLSS